jgi:DNA-binding PadR family transcriptional regulator
MAVLRHIVNKTEQSRTVAEAILDILDRRTGSVISNEIAAAFALQWAMPDGVNSGLSKWLSQCLIEMRKKGLVVKIGMLTTAEKNKNGGSTTSNRGVYEITQSGREYLRSGEIAPEPAPEPEIDERDGFARAIDDYRDAVSDAGDLPHVLLARKFPVARQVKRKKQKGLPQRLADRDYIRRVYGIAA